MNNRRRNDSIVLLTLGIVLILTLPGNFKWLGVTCVAGSLVMMISAIKFWWEQRSAAESNYKVLYEEIKFSFVGFSLGIVAALIGPALAVLTFFLFSKPKNYVMAIIILIFSIFVIARVWRRIIWPIVKRWLAEQAIIFLWVPDMTAAFQFRNKRLFRILINCSLSDRRVHFERLARAKNALYGYDRFVVIDPNIHGDIISLGESANLNDSIGLPWYKKIGWPWSDYLMKPWYEHSNDFRNPAAQPVRFLDLRLRQIDWEPLEMDSEGNIKKDEFGNPIGVVPAVDTTDPMQVTAHWTVEAQIWDPEKAILGQPFFMEGFQKALVAVWRQTISRQSYFDKEPPKGRSLAEAIATGEITPIIQQLIDRVFNVDALGVGTVFESDGDDRSWLKVHQCVMETDLEDPTDNFPKNSPAWWCWHNYGLQLLGVAVRDLDPTDPVLAAAIRGKSKAQALAAQEIQAAMGRKRTLELEGEGEGAKRAKIGEGDAKAIRARAEAMKEDGAAQVLARDAVEAMAKGNTVIVDGGFPGMVAQVKKVIQALEAAKDQKEEGR